MIHKILISKLIIYACLFGTTNSIDDPTSNLTTPLRESIRNKFEGVQLTFLHLEIQNEYYDSKIKGFQELTGAKVNRVVTSTSDWFSHLEEDMAGGGLIDLYSCFGIWIPTFADKGALMDLTEHVQHQPGLDWFDVLPAVRKGVAAYKGSIYNIPLDGNVIIMLYRSDLVEGVGLPTPKTWEDVLHISEYYKNKDINQDGEIDFANCFATGDIGHKIFWAVASSFLQTQGTEQGIFFDPETFQPKSSDPKFIEILEIYNKLVQTSPFRDFGPTDWRATLPEFQNGRCVLFFNYPGPARILISNQEANNMTGLLNYATLPGMKCNDAIKCPYSKDGANHAPFLADGGIGFAVSARSSPIVQQAALAFAFYLSDPAVNYWDVAYPGSLLDPYRQRLTVALSNPETPESQAFRDFGWEPRQLEMVKEVTEFNFINGNYVQDLRILGVVEYQSKSTMPHLVQMWYNNATAIETADAITASWNIVTEKFGLQEQRDMYRKTLGLQPYVETDNSVTNIVIPVVISFAILVVILLLVSAKLGHTIKYKTRETANAPKKGNVAILFTDVEGSTALWDASKTIMSKALKIHHETIRKLIQKHKAYEVKTIGDSFMIAAGSADAAVRLANDIQQEFLNVSWPIELASMPSSCVEYFPVKRNDINKNGHINFDRKKMFSGLRVRIGVHIGSRERNEIEIEYDPVTKGYDYYGQSTNAAARIEAMGFGGQTIISQAIYNNLTGSVIKESNILQLGEVELRGVSKPVFLYQCLPLSLKGRRFAGILRRRSSSEETEATNDSHSDLHPLENTDLEGDEMAMTPVQLQRTVVRLRKIIAQMKLERELNAASSVSMSGSNNETVH